MGRSRLMDLIFIEAVGQALGKTAAEDMKKKAEEREHNVQAFERCSHTDLAKIATSFMSVLDLVHETTDVPSVVHMAMHMTIEAAEETCSRAAKRSGPDSEPVQPSQSEPSGFSQSEVTSARESSLKTAMHQERSH